MEPVNPMGDTPSELEQLQQALTDTERRLAEAQQQIAELEALLEEIPEIFERKFEQRLQPVLERQSQLLAQLGSSGGIDLPQLPGRADSRRADRAFRRGPRAA